MKLVRHRNEHRTEWTSLSEVPLGKTAVLAMPHAEKQLCRRLAQLGLRPGMKVTVAQRTSGGGRVVRSGSARYALDSATLKELEVA